MGEDIGWKYQKIRDSIKRTIATTIDAKETFYRKKTKSWGSIMVMSDVYIRVRNLRTVI